MNVIVKSPPAAESMLTPDMPDDVFDIDYATYKILLREWMAAGRMSDSKIPTEETEILEVSFL